MSPRRLLAALLAAPLAAFGVCGAVAPILAARATCSAEAEPGDCCSRSSSPTSSRTPAPDRCAACGAAAFALGETREAARPARDSAESSVAGRPGVARAVRRTAAAETLSFLSASPPKHVLLATFRN